MADYPAAASVWQSRLAPAPAGLLDRLHHDRPRVSPDLD